MNTIKLPSHFNYVEAYLTYRCTLHCNYCINKFDEFKHVDEMDTNKWIKGLGRIETREDLPITLGGGEPLLHCGFYKIANALRYQYGKTLDLLTNGLFDVRKFMYEITPEVFRRNAKYASIRFSHHLQTPPEVLAQKVWTMQNEGYSVGIWGLDHPTISNVTMAHICKWLNIDYRTKEFLGWYKGRLYGTYRYPKAVGQIVSKKVYCQGSEMLINPAGHIFRCHADLYANRNPIAHILDEKIEFPGFKKCNYYGQCNPCDVKIKFNRFQEKGHCAVNIKERG